MHVLDELAQHHLAHQAAKVPSQTRALASSKREERTGRELVGLAVEPALRSKLLGRPPPALIAMLLMLPVLTVIADVMAILGAALYCSPALDISVPAYIVQTLHLLDPGDLWQGLSKSVVFAILITLVGVSTGFGVSGGAEGVGRATTRAVVYSISAIVVADMIFSFFLNR